MPKRITIFASAFFILIALTSCQSKEPETLQSPALLPVQLELTTPSSGWSLALTQAWLTENNEILCISQLTPPVGMTAQVISKVQTTASLKTASNSPIKHFVLGKTWGWESNPSVTFIDKLSQIQEELENAHAIIIAK